MLQEGPSPQCAKMQICVMTLWLLLMFPGKLSPTLLRRLAQYIFLNIYKLMTTFHYTTALEYAFHKIIDNANCCAKPTK